jgi:hypothetical protein
MLVYFLTVIVIFFQHLYSIILISISSMHSSPSIFLYSSFKTQTHSLMLHVICISMWWTYIARTSVTVWRSGTPLCPECLSTSVYHLFVHIAHDSYMSKDSATFRAAAYQFGMYIRSRISSHNAKCTCMLKKANETLIVIFYYKCCLLDNYTE